MNHRPSTMVNASPHQRITTSTHHHINASTHQRITTSTHHRISFRVTLIFRYGGEKVAFCHVTLVKCHAGLLFVDNLATKSYAIFTTTKSSASLGCRFNSHATSHKRTSAGFLTKLHELCVSCKNRRCAGTSYRNKRKGSQKYLSTLNNLEWDVGKHDIEQRVYNFYLLILYNGNNSYAATSN